MSDPHRHDHAVALCCDRAFFPFALFMVWQIAHHNPHRRFDIVISSQDALEVPDWATSYGIVLHRTGPVPVTVDVSRFGGSVATLFRLMLARELGDRYRKILYLDCDMAVDGGDINRLFETDLGPHPIGAVLDAPHFYVADYRAREFTAAALPAAPYFNSGLQMIDTQAYREQEVERRACAMVTTYPGAICYTDQSLLNLALQGKFAQLAPCWNWQWAARYPLMAVRYPVFMTHFLGSKKPDRSPLGDHGVRFNQAYRGFFASFMPDLLPKVAPPCDPAPMTFGDAARIVFRHVTGAQQFGAMLARFPDPYRAVV